MIDWVSQGAICARAAAGRRPRGASAVVMEREPVDRADRAAADDHRGVETRAPDRLEPRQELGMGDDEARIGIVDHVLENPARGTRD